MKCIFTILFFLFFVSCKESKTDSNYVDFKGSKIYYEVSGRGANTILFIHGWGCNLNVWKYQEAYFKHKSNVILVDLPGFGKSSKDFTNYSIELFANSILEVLVDLRINQVHLVGHSLGHPIAKKIAEINPDKVASITIVDGVYFDFPLDAQENKVYKEQLIEFVSMFSGEDRISNTEAFINSLFIESTTQEIRNYTDTTMMLVPESIGSNVMENLIQEDIWEKNEIKTNTLAIYANIPELPENNSTVLGEWYPNLEYVEIDNVGHFLMMEKSEHVNKIVDEFVNGK